MAPVYELDSNPRQFLFFSVFNVISWQCIVGPALILFARTVAMPESLVGVIQSFLPLSMLLVLTVPHLVASIGPKRLLLVTWLSRNLAACAIFLTPWAMRVWGSKAAWWVIIWVTLSFCVIRAVGAGGWLPWLHELVPDTQRGIYFSLETSFTQLMNVAIMIVQATVLQEGASVGRFLVVYAIGIVAGLMSLYWMVRIPGGAGAETAVSFREGIGEYVATLRHRPFVRFVLIASLGHSCLWWLGSAMVMYLRDAQGFSARAVMFQMAVASWAVLMTIRFWGRYADYCGSGRAMFKALTAHSLVALLCLLAWPGAPWTRWALWPLVIGYCVFAAAFGLAANRAMLNATDPAARVGYTNLWTFGTAMAQGVTPILAGSIIEHFGLWGFRLCFLVSGVGGLACALGCLHVIRDGAPLHLTLARMADPALALRILARIARITLGHHESRRGTPARETVTRSDCP